MTRPQPDLRSRRAHVVGFAAVSVVLMLAAAVPAPDPGAVFPRFYSVELASSLLHVGLYLGVLLCAGLGWLRLVADVPFASQRHQHGAGLLAAVSVALLVPVDAVRLIGGPPADLFRPRVWIDGVTTEVLGAGATVAVGIGLATIVPRLFERPPRWWAVTGPSIALLAPLWLGHSRTETPRPVMLVADVVHLVAAAWWVAGLSVFAIVLLRGSRSGVEPGAIADAMGRFSRIAVPAAAAVAGSGVLMSLLIVDGPGDYVATSWGRALLVKILIVGGVVCIARWNVRHLALVVRNASGDATQWSALRMTMATELSLILAAVVVTGFLTQLSPG